MNIKNTIDEVDNNNNSQIASNTTKKSILYTLGLRLSAAREEQKQTINVIADELCIRSAYIRAFEKGDWSTNSDLPAGVYAQGFLRQYANHLDLILTDTELMAVRQALQIEEHANVFIPDPPIAPRRYWIWLTAACLLAAIVYFNIYYVQPTESQLDSEQSILESAPTKTNTRVVEYITPRFEQEQIEPIAQSTTTETQVLQPNLDTKSEMLIISKTINDNYSSKNNNNNSAKAISNTSTIIKFSARGADVWFSIHNINGKKLGESLLKDGQTWQYNAASVLRTAKKKGIAGVLLLNCGNASPLEIKRGNVFLATAGSLGARGKVLRNYRLVISK